VTYLLERLIPELVDVPADPLTTPATETVIALVAPNGTFIVIWVEVDDVVVLPDASPDQLTLYDVAPGTALQLAFILPLLFIDQTIIVIVPPYVFEPLLVVPEVKNTKVWSPTFAGDCDI
jgi:hypothetical protein